MSVLRVVEVEKMDEYQKRNEVIDALFERGCIDAETAMKHRNLARNKVLRYFGFDTKDFE